MLCTCTHSSAHANDVKIMRSRDAQCNKEESPSQKQFWYLLECSVPKGGEVQFKPRPQKRILIPPRGLFQNFLGSPPAFNMKVPSGPVLFWVQLNVVFKCYT